MNNLFQNNLYKNIWSPLLFMSVVLLLIILLLPNNTSALSGDAYRPGNIIDDAVFYNSNSMSPQQIQNFLNSKVPNCDTNGTQLHSSGVTRAQRGAANGNPAPFTCLKDYSQNVPAVTNGGSDLCKHSISAGLKSAASIIYDVAKACEINPQALIVMLQKEQSLITDDWPWETQYNKAMGYYCPDDPNRPGWCHPDYAGFFNQVYNAAEAFRRYEANPNGYNYKAQRNNNILWQANAGSFRNDSGNLVQYDSNGNGIIDGGDAQGCGYKSVFIENQATASLYIYTPYQPNSAALNNLYGTGDTCSAYGNRNFWRMFNDWFGSTSADAYSSTPYSSWSSIPTATMVSGDKAKIVFKVRNTGNQVWSNTNTKLGTAEPFDRVSTFRDSTWLSANRVTKLKETTVNPGDVGTFEFWYKASSLGVYTEKFSVVVEGAGWTPYAGLFLTTNVVNPNYSATTISAGSYKDETTSVGRSTSNVAPGEKAYVVVRIKNQGNRTWVNSGTNVTRLATSGPIGRGSAYNYGWLSSSRLSNMEQTSVAPGQVATFKFWYRAPNITGTHKEEFTLVHEGKSWSDYFGFHLNTTVSSPDLSATPVSAASNIATGTMKKGTKALITFKVRNTGNSTWSNSNTRLGTAEPLGRISTFRYNSWPSANRTTKLVENTVAPGEIGTFEFWYQAPNNLGTYEERFTPVVEGVSWLPYTGLYLKTKVVN